MLHRRTHLGRTGFGALFMALTTLVCAPSHAQDELGIAQVPLFLGQGTTPLVMLVMGRDHKFYYEAYNDASDLNNDGVIDIGYKGHLNCETSQEMMAEGEKLACAEKDPTDKDYNPFLIDYFGYFNSYQCYSYSNGVFVPKSTTADKTCSGSWSGDFLNYVTMTRMDALRKVLYGGYRSSDPRTGTTILERAYVPQDAHTWAKEYKSIAEDGYDIADYAPYSEPVAGTRHLFANMTRYRDQGTNFKPPKLRGLSNSPHRAWEWVSIERLVGENKCNNINNDKVDCEKNADPGGSLDESGAPNSSDEFATWVDRFERDDNLLATTTLTQIDDGDLLLDDKGNAVDYGGQTEDFLTIIRGTITLRRGDPQTFMVDGNDAIELLIDGKSIASRFGTHGMVCKTFNVRDDQETCVGTPQFDNGIVTSTPVADANGMVVGTLSGNRQHSLEIRHIQRSGAAGLRMYWYNYGRSRWELYAERRMSGLTQEVYKLVDAPTPASKIEEYIVRVQACVLAPEDDPNCKLYGEGSSEVWKPAGLLQKYGDEDEMLFGLLTGSFEKSTKGGVMRKNVGTLTDEINLNTGQFRGTVGIIETINALRIATFTKSSYEYDNCGWITDKPLSEAGDGKCADWGNPIAEMMYEAMRYFAGKEKPTPAFDTSGGLDEKLGLPAPEWKDPYLQDGGDYSVCSRPNLLVIGDVNPSYDTDQLPGSSFSNFGGDLEGLNVTTEADLIWKRELGGSKRVFVGETTTESDFAPTPKRASSFADIRGIAPEDPSKQGGWYAASVAYHGLKTDLNEAPGEQNIRTFAVAMASPLPRIEIPIREVTGGDSEDPEFGEVVNTVILVPFAKSVGGGYGINKAEGRYQPTNTIVDFYIEELRDDYGKFRINYEDVEQGADHDMDMIVEYIYRITDMRNRIIEVELNSTYAAGGIIQHAGYVISGTTRDGVYLEVRDVDTGANNDPDYFLDTPNNADPLPLSTTRTFRALEEDRPEILKDPLWYAAKWGNFNNFEENEEEPEPNPEPDKQLEWDTDGDDKPDNYFLVTNALHLSEQLSKAFEEIMDQVSSASGATANSTRLNTNLVLYASQFTSGVWTGDLLAYRVNQTTRKVEPVPAWRAADAIPAPGERRIFTMDDNGNGIEFIWSNLSEAQRNALSQNEGDDVGQRRLDFLRGDNTHEEPAGEFRRRVEDLNQARHNALGDIVNSTAAYVANANFGFQVLPDNLGGDEYAEFRSTVVESRRPMVYVGANDGMLHAIDGRVADETSENFEQEKILYTGREEWAFIPSMVMPRLHELTDPDYVHNYFVDGSPRTIDAYFERPGSNQPSWGSVLVGILGGGGSGIFAIDVTDPDEEFNADNFLWEYSSADDGDFGFSMSQPATVAMNDGKFRVIVGNGYNSASNRASLFILDVSDGSKIKEITTSAPVNQGPNGLSSPVPVDVNGDRVVDVVYAGDLLGNLWKFDVSNKQPNQWGVELLFTAEGPSGELQPITSRPTITGHPSGDVMVLFGTGRYFAVNDQVLPPLDIDRDVYTFYGIRDSGSGTVSRADLLAQEITNEDPYSPDDPAMFRETSRYEPEEGTEPAGWYLDLVSPVEGKQTERVVVEPVMVGESVVFVTLVPSEEPCSFGGDGWVMVMNALTGQQSEGPILDTNRDGEINDADDPAAGIRSTVGILSKPAVVRNPDGTTTLYIRGNDHLGGGGPGGDGSDPDENEAPGTMSEDVLGDSRGGRQAWRQIQ